MFLHPFMLSAAQLERDLRRRHYPAYVEQGKLSQEEADGEIAAWSAIAELIEKRSCECSLSWGELEMFAARALARRQEACESDPANPRLTERRDLVASIHAGIARQREWFESVGADLRRGQGRKAA